MRRQVSFGPGANSAANLTSDPETPEGRRITRSKHVPTPKMSGRKKSLFGATVGENTNVEEADLGPMSPLKFSNSPRDRRGPMKAINTTTFRNILGNASPESDRSLSPDYERRFCHSERYEILPATYDKENSHLTDEDTRHSFPSGTPRMRTPAESALLDETNSNSLSLLMSSDLNLVDKKNLVLKTPGLNNTGQNRELKLSFRKLSFPGGNAASTPTDENSPPEVTNGNERKARTSLSFGEIRPISTKSFYSSAIEISAKPVSKPVAQPPRSKARPQRKRPSAKNRGNSIRLGSLNRGVFHKIKKPTAAKPKTASTVKKLSTSQIMETTTSSLLNKSIEQKPGSKSTPSSPHDKQTQQQLARISQILRNSKNPIEQARPLSLSRSMSNLADLIAAREDEESEQSEQEPERAEVDDADEDAKSEVGGARKFFKSSGNRRIKREYKVTDKVSATVGKGGKISLNRSGKEQKKRKFKSMFEEEIDFESEQHEVDDLISHFECEQLEVDDLISKLTDHQQQSSCPIDEDLPQSELLPPVEPEPVTLTFDGLLNSEISNDEPIPVQSNVIIVDRLSPLTATSESDSNGEVPFNDQMVQIRTMTNANVSEKLFPIFHKDHQRAVAQAEASQQQIYGGLFDRKRQRRLRTWRPIGSDQYQIDAGQKEYGAQQCAECGLMYTVHEPEEELIHENYHNSLHVLKFGGWSNEIAVAQVPEWDVSGRVLAVTLTDGRHQLQKVQEVLAVVDRELGYVEPCQLTAGSIVYLAVARSVILGVCVAQPLQQANRLLTIEGLQGSFDCCTMETYPARCGISRIWVSPRYRGNGIARTLLSVTRSHFVFGYHMSYDEVAFSAPTEAGKRLAESVTGRKDFLIYM